MWVARLEREEWIALVCVSAFVFVLAAVPLVVSVVVSPEAIESGAVHLSAPCPSKAKGEPCAACGMTRGFCAMSRGRFWDAIHYNAASPAVYGAFVFVALGAAWVTARAVRGAVRASPSPGDRAASRAAA